MARTPPAMRRCGHRNVIFTRRSDGHRTLAALPVCLGVEHQLPARQVGHIDVPPLLTRAEAQRGRRGGNCSQETVNGPPNAQHFAIVLDRQLQSVPYIDYCKNPDGIPGDNGAVIDVGNGGIGEAKRLALILQTGALPYDFKQLERTDVSATLGKDSLNQAKRAAIVGLVIVAIFLLLLYLFLVLVAVLGLGIYAAFLYAAILLFNVTLTLANLSPAGSVGYVDEAGWHSKSISPFPGAEVLAGQQGLGLAALKWMRDCGDELGMPICVEVMDTRQVSEMEPLVDCFQIGARNMQNFDLLREVGKTRRPVLLSGQGL